ncbi:hypothetical protein IAR55_004841 [Kwoniella newhampshirensis]|uniref:F-box domain-containing protein n=1 Tax=Kwoniella newhampshirensis TaxID=1651941 RepID=A0AAW0YI47_9TREE
MAIVLDEQGPLPSGASTPTTNKPFRRTPLPLPYDLLHILITLLQSSDSFATLSLLSRCSRSYYALITPLLYTNVHITSDEQLQALLSLPADRRGFLGVKRYRSGSIINGVVVHPSLSSRERKVEALSLIERLTLDVYPSRTSLKLASKLPWSLPAQEVTLTSKAVSSLNTKLGHSKAPRILASFWASHFPSLVRPRKVVVDYSDLDVRHEMMNEERKEGWWDTFSGLSVGIQAWKELEEVQVKGEVWNLILPNPGVKVRMVHTIFPPPQPDGEGEGNMVPPMESTPASASEESTNVWRDKLITDRRKALVSGLSTSYFLLEQALANTNTNTNTTTTTNGSPVRMANHPIIEWEIQDFLPPYRGQPGVLEEVVDEGDGVRRGIMADLDQVCPALMERYARMENGRRELSCLKWI